MELVDTQVSEACAERCAGSSPALGTSRRLFHLARGLLAACRCFSQVDLLSVVVADLVREGHGGTGVDRLVKLVGDLGEKQCFFERGVGFALVHDGFDEIAHDSVVL